MNLGTLILIISLIVILYIIWRFIKPYIIKYDTTILITGGLGSGKTLESVKKGILLYRKQLFYKYTIYNKFNVELYNFFAKKINKKRALKPYKPELKQLNKNSHEFYNKNICIEWFKKEPLKLRLYRPKPQLYSNIPIYYKEHFYTPKKKRKYSEVFLPTHALCLKKITEYSVVVIDEFPQFVNQFEWKNPIVQTNLNEWITFFRHYVGGYLIINAQSSDEIECHVRRKLNQAIWCFDFKKHFFGLFYTQQICDMMMSDSISTMTTSYIEDNTKKHYGLFPPKHTYDTRCYSVRYENIIEKANPREYFLQLKTYRVLRLNYYISPLDLKTTYEEKIQQLTQAQKLMQLDKNISDKIKSIK